MIVSEIFISIYFPIILCVAILYMICMCTGGRVAAGPAGGGGRGGAAGGAGHPRARAGAAGAAVGPRGAPGRGCAALEEPARGLRAVERYKCDEVIELDMDNKYYEFMMIYSVVCKFCKYESYNQWNILFVESCKMESYLKLTDEINMPHYDFCCQLLIFLLQLE